MFKHIWMMIPNDQFCRLKPPSRRVIGVICMIAFFAKALHFSWILWSYSGDRSKPSLPYLQRMNIQLYQSVIFMWQLQVANFCHHKKHIKKPREIGTQSAKIWDVHGFSMDVPQISMEFPEIFSHGMAASPLAPGGFGPFGGPTHQGSGSYRKTASSNRYPPVNEHSYGLWPIETDGLPMKNGDFKKSYVSLRLQLVGGDWNHGILWLSHHIGNFIIPTDELIFFRGVGQPPTRW